MHTDKPLDDVDDYAQLAANQITARGDVTIVGHSGAGTLLPSIAAALDAVAVVWLAAYIPDFVNGRSLVEEIHTEPAKLFHPEWVGIDPIRDPDAARHFLFHDCNPGVQDWALGTLRAFIPAAGYQHKPGLRRPAAASTVIAPTRDRTLRADWIREAAVERLGVQPVLVDAGHCPHVSQPETVADILVNIVTDPPGR
ncbi:hypothetical protein MBRA_08740 [Mycobacterium branderi]|uniref:AB hydrolase-1 domain-containing protein n=1 Tax=Mycobacterium branderi TaxID=43348 RepID=A0ABM7KHN3_9MYCO|nr:hypothetical protein MBRA_08740 [Mycobacterium branderi]